MGLGAEEAAEDPLVADERIDLKAFLGGEGLEAGDVFVLEFGEPATVFSGDVLRLGVESGFEGVE
ncbi:MAG TPA: hypothetical protein VLY24_21060 [Bryobacteraceae bacterium]|nr:hypothetical protein [Bryobacteraceae bacterium]